MRSYIREAALRYDLGATLWRVGVTQDNKELTALLPEQLRALVVRYPEDCAQFAALQRLIRHKETLAN
jgi:hypothetical protein